MEEEDFETPKNGPEGEPGQKEEQEPVLVTTVEIDPEYDGVVNKKIRRYACFLSHFQAQDRLQAEEGGSELPGDLLRDQLQRGVPRSGHEAGIGGGLLACRREALLFAHRAASKEHPGDTAALEGPERCFQLVLRATRLLLERHHHSLARDREAWE